MSSIIIEGLVRDVLMNLTYYDDKVAINESSLKNDLKLNQHSIRALAVPLTKIVKKYKPSNYVKMSECLIFETVKDAIDLTQKKSGF